MSGGTEAGMDRDRAARDIRFIREVLDRTHRRIDPHAFHFVLWGAIVLVWYPLLDHFRHAGRLDLYGWTCAAALLLGFALSSALEWRTRRRFGESRLGGEDTFVSRQVGRITKGCVSAAVVLSALGPSLGFVEGPHVPVVWGLAYAVMAYMTGVVYSREWMVAGAAIFVGAVAAMAVPEWNGTILGPFMGLGMIVPGVIAERRVRRMQGSPVEA